MQVAADVMQFLYYVGGGVGVGVGAVAAIYARKRTNGKSPAPLTADALKVVLLEALADHRDNIADEIRSATTAAVSSIETAFLKAVMADRAKRGRE